MLLVSFKTAFIVKVDVKVIQGSSEQVIFNVFGSRSYLALFAPIKGGETIKVFLNPKMIRSVTVGKLSKSSQRKTY